MGPPLRDLPCAEAAGVAAVAMEEGVKMVPAAEGVGVALGKPPGADASRAAPVEVDREEAAEEEEEQERS